MSCRNQKKKRYGMKEWMDEWMNGWMNECINGWINEWMNEWMFRKKIIVNGWNKKMHECVKEEMNGWK